MEEQERRRRFLQLWAVASMPLLLASVIVILNGGRLAWITTAAVLAGVFVGVEAIARRRFLSFLASLLLLGGAILVGVGLARLFREHWRLAMSAVIGAASLALLIGNLRDLRHGWRSGPEPQGERRADVP